MAKYYSGGVVIRAGQEIVELSPAMLDFIENYNARQKVLLDDGVRRVARERAREDAESAVNGFIAICVLAAIAISFLIAL
jgi:hypothetical protein